MGESKSSNGAKAFGGVLALVAIIAGVYAMVEPMGQRIEFMQTELHRLTKENTKQNETTGNILANIASVKEKFVEVETQFRALREVTQLKHAFKKQRINNLEKRIMGKVADRWTKADAEKVHDKFDKRLQTLEKKQ